MCGAPAQPLIALPLPRAILRLAWPAMASMLLVNVFNLVDAFWVGRLGTDALGGMTASAFLVWCFHSVGLLVANGVSALVARRVGAGQPAEAGVAGGQGLLLALGLAAVVTTVGLAAQGPVLQAMGVSPAVRAAGVAYLTPILYGFGAVTLWFALEAHYRGSGDTRTPMLVLGGALALNALLDPLLIFGLGPLPALGIAGAGWATAASHLASVAAALRLLRGRDIRPRLRPPDGAVLWAMIRVGTPVALTALLFSVIYLLLTPIIARYGSAAVAAVGLCHRVEGLVYFTCVGFAAAATTLVGQHLGAQNPSLAERAAWWATGACAAVLVLPIVAFVAAAPGIISLFSGDPAVAGYGVSYLRVVAPFDLFMSLELTLEGAFIGAGWSLPPMLVGVPLTAARVPAAHLLSARWGLGAEGVWWAIGLSTLGKGLLTAWWFRRGGWKAVRL